MPTSSLKSQGLSPCSVIQESTAGTAGLTDAFYLGIIKKKTFSTRVRTNYLRVLWGKKNHTQSFCFSGEVVNSSSPTVPATDKRRNPRLF